MATDAELIGWACAGDEEALVEVVRRHAVGVLAYLERRVGRGAAEDLLGDVWVAAFGSRASYDRSYPDAGPWLLGIARNTLRRHWRTKPTEDPAADLASLPVLLDPWPVVDAQIDGAAALRRAVARLPAEEREVLLLVVWEDLSVADAGRTLGVPAGTARRRLHQARMALRSAPGMVALLTEYNAVK